jgi:hypothetical protein
LDDVTVEEYHTRFEFENLSRCARAASFSPQSIYYIAQQLLSGRWKNAPRNRAPSWSTGKQSDFVASIFRGCAISPLFVNQNTAGLTHIFDGSNRCCAIRNFFQGFITAPLSSDAGELVQMRYTAQSLHSRANEHHTLSLSDYPHLKHNFENFTMQVVRFDHMSEEEVSAVALVLNLGTPMAVGEKARLLVGTPRANYLSALYDETDCLSASPCFAPNGDSNYYLWLALLVRAEVDAEGDANCMTLPKRLYHYRAFELWYTRTHPLPLRLRTLSDDPVRAALAALAGCAHEILSKEHLSATYVAIRRSSVTSVHHVRAVAKAAEAGGTRYESALESAVSAAATLRSGEGCDEEDASVEIVE